MKKLLLTLVFASSALNAAQDNIEAALWKAAAFVDVGEYVSAVHAYQNLTTLGLPNWQQDLVRYNIGTSVLLKGLFDEASIILGNIIVDKKTPALFLRSLETNNALGHINQSEADWSEALKAIKHAAHANCQVYLETTGEPSCIANHNRWVSKFREMRAYIKQRQADVKPSPIGTLTEGLFYLAMNLRELKSRLSLFKNEQYQPYIEKDKQTLKSVWDMISEQMEATQKKEFEENQVKLWELIDKQEWKPVSSLLLDMSQKLFSLLESQQDEFSEAIQPMFQRLFSESPMQIASVFTLQQAIELASELSKKQKWQEAFSKALKSANAGGQSLQKKMPTTAAIQLGIAYSVLQQVKYDKSAIPQKVLTDIIADESHQLRLTQFMIDRDESEAIDDKLMEVLYKEQSQTLGMVKDYFQSVLVFQNKNFRGEKKELQCQCTPWNTVLPLVEEGKLAAGLAAAELEKDHPEFAIVDENQRKAIDKWQKALEEQNKQSPEESPSDQQQDQSMNQVFQQLQEMDIEDQRPAAPSSGQLGGNRPW